MNARAMQPSSPLRSGKPIDPSGQAGDPSCSLVLVDDPLGGGLLDNGNCLFEVFSGLFYSVGRNSGPDVFDRLFDPCFVALVSNPSDLVLSRPFQGRWMVCQIVVSLCKGFTLLNERDTEIK